MNNKVVAVLVVLLLIVGGFLLFKNSSVAPTENDLELGMLVPGNEVDEMVVENEVVDTSAAKVREFNVDASSYKFSPANITVNKGDTIKLTVKNVDGTHDFKIDEFTGASTKILKTGETQTITFVVDRAGTFEYYCSIGQHRAMGMVGKLTVK